MIKAIINGLLSLLMTIVNIVLLPINALIGTIFPDLTNYLSGALTLLANVANGIAFVANFMPPLFKTLVIITITTLMYYYTILWSYTLISKAWTLIQKIKFW